jgi:hypothetical protein
MYNYRIWPLLITPNWLTSCQVTGMIKCHIGQPSWVEHLFLHGNWSRQTDEHDRKRPDSANVHSEGLLILYLFKTAKKVQDGTAQKFQWDEKEKVYSFVKMIAMFLKHSKIVSYTEVNITEIVTTNQSNYKIILNYRSKVLCASRPPLDCQRDAKGWPGYCSRVWILAH